MRRRKVTAFALPFILVLMLAQPVSATDTIYDEVGDIPIYWSNADGSPVSNVWSSNPPLAQVGYFDMTSYSLTLEGDHYRFCMSVLADLPVEGEAIPSGITVGEWAMWIDPEPFNWVLNPVTPLFTIELLYDESEYSAYLVDYSSGTRAMIPPESHEQSGTELWIEFSADVVAGLDLENLWWAATTRIHTGSGTYTFRFVDISNWDPVLQAYDIPWPV